MENKDIFAPPTEEELNLFQEEEEMFAPPTSDELDSIGESSSLEKGVRGAIHSATLGTSPYIEAALKTLGNEGSYEENLAKVKEELAEIEDTDPFLAGSLAGLLVPGSGVAKLGVKGLQLLKKYPMAEKAIKVGASIANPKAAATAFAVKKGAEVVKKHAPKAVEGLKDIVTKKSKPRIDPFKVRKK